MVISGDSLPTLKMAMMTAHSRRIFSTAFEEVSTTFGARETAAFSSFSLSDLRDICLEIERKLEAKRRSSIRKLRPFFDGVERYSKTIEVLCSGTPFLPWVWVSLQYSFEVLITYIAQAPAKLVLQVFLP